MRRQTTEGQGSLAAFEQREQELLRLLNSQLAANAALAKELDSFRESHPNLDQLKTVSALLLPPTRETGRVATVSVAGGTDLVVLLLRLESDDFPTYRVGLKVSATNQIVWLSANLEAAPSGSSKIVAVSFPAHLLRQKNYVLELSGFSSKEGRAELIGDYPIRVMLK
jgi:DNA-binding transcriptional LysR family regulator